MKRLTVGFLGVALGFALLVNPIATANAQFSVGLGVGGTFLTGDAGDSFKTGWIVDLIGDYRFGEGQSPVSVRLDIMYGENNLNAPSGSSADGKLKNTFGLAYVLVHILPPETSSVDLYFGGGGGFVSGKFTSSGFSSDSETDGALSGIFGIGLPVGGGNIKIFFEGKWVTIFTEGSSTNVIPATAGASIAF